jgi:hypothetical protein
MRSNDNFMLLTTISAGASLCIHSQSFNKFYEKYFRYKLWTHMYTKLFNIHHHIVSICRSMALIFGSMATLVYIRCIDQMLFGFKCDWINTDSVAWNMKWYWLIVLYIKVRTVHIYWIYFHTCFKLFQPYNEQWDHITNIQSYSHTVIQKDSKFSHQFWLLLQVTVKMVQNLFCFLCKAGQHAFILLWW